MHALLTIAMVLAGGVGSPGAGAGGEEGAPGPDQGFREALVLPDFAFPVIAVVVFLGLLLVTFAFRSTHKRH